MRALYFYALAACGSHSAAVATGDAAHDAAPDSPPDANPCGLRAGPRGMSQRTMTVAGLDRTYIVYLPQGVSAATPIPLVFVHHGYTMAASDMYAITGYTQLADQEHIAVVFPDGEAGPHSTGAPWNVGSNVCPSTAGEPTNGSGDDFAFLDAMKADVLQDQCIDREHIFVTGFSMGGYFSHHVGCMRSDIRAVAPHSGGTHPLDQCPVAHKPILILHGAADPLIPDGCDDPAAAPVAGVEPSAAAWAAHNGCGTTTHSRTVMNGTCVTYDNCPADGQVELCTFTAMGHCWAGGASNSIYACSSYESATTLTWQFFKQYAW